jgi:hypothetical protein
LKEAMQPDDLATGLSSKLGDRLLGVEPFAGTAGRIRFRPEAALEVFRTLDGRGNRLGDPPGSVLRCLVGRPA